MTSRLILAIATALTLALCVGCDRKPTNTSEPSAEPPRKPTEASPTPSAAPAEPPPASASTAAPQAIEEPKCLSPAEVAAIEEYDSWRFRVPHRVVRVARSDTLALREAPSPTAPALAQLPFDQGDIVATKKICKVGPAEWAEVKVLGKTGWVNWKYLAKATTLHDRTKTYLELEGAKPTKTPWALAQAIVQDMNTPSPEEGRYKAEVIDVVTSGGAASAIIYAFGELDDSVGGEQTLVTMVKTDLGWTVRRADTNILCYRGPDPKGNPALCI